MRDGRVVRVPRPAVGDHRLLGQIDRRRRNLDDRERHRRRPRRYRAVAVCDVTSICLLLPRHDPVVGLLGVLGVGEFLADQVDLDPVDRAAEGAVGAAHIVVGHR